MASSTTWNPLYKAPAEIPTLDQWLRASSNARFQFMDRRGSPEIRAIDQRVDAYSKLEARKNVPTAQLWQAAIELLEAIEVYLATPRGHKQRRSDAVHMLKLQTKAVITKLRWQKIKDVAGSSKPGMKPMVEHVWSEMHSPGHARVGHGDNSLDPNPWLEGKPEAKEKYLFQYLRKVRAEGAPPDNVLYIEDSEKWKYQIVFTPTGLAHERGGEMGGLVLQDSKPITTTAFDNLSTTPYAVDEDGVFYTETSGHTGGTINHCSFLSGRPVMCAGNIGITNGVVGYIDNGSGHYRPSVQNLLKCLKALKDQVSPLYFDAIIVRNHAGLNSLAAYLAGKFLATQGHCLPVGYYPSAGARTHYRKDLVEFQSKDEIPAFLSQQDANRQRAKLEKDLKQLVQRLEFERGKGDYTLKSDADRNVLKAVLISSLIPEDQKAGLKIYYQNDQTMMQWVAAQRSPTPRTDFSRPRAQTLR